LPTGTVTFLFTDVEGSTELWEADHGAMQAALRDHDALLHAAVAARGGVVFKTIGDAFCAAFYRPEEAVNAAVDAQRELARHAWPASIEAIRVRMGIHTGTAVEQGGDYFGPTVNRVARLMSIGYGEQILVSGATAALLRDAMPDGITLRDAGVHRLKGLSQPENAFQVVAGDLRAEFPPLRSADAPADAAPPHNLPHPLTTFFGRDAELAAIAAELTRHRLVTLAGFGGVGKTRMAIETARQLLTRFDDAVYLVELAPIADPAFVAGRIAAALGVPSQAGQLAGDLWVDALRERRALLVLDNCEHVIDAVGAIAQRLLERCVHVHILATSREPLRLPGERVVRIAPLAAPVAASAHDGAALGSFLDSPAVRLFLDRVSNADPAFRIPDDDAQSWEAVASVCRRLDGIPLAIELAAARVSTLGLPRLVAGLDNRFRVLTGGARTSLPRHQTLQATLDWSYAVLDPDEQHVFARLGVFAGTFTADAAGAVCANDVLSEDDAIAILSSLVDRSLVVADASSGAARYRLLETTRAYALTRLKERADLDGARRAHAAFFASVAAIARSMFGTRSFIDWVEQYRADVDNFRAVLAWTIEERGDVLLGATMLCDLKRLFEWLTLNAEVLAWCERALSELGADAPPALEAELLSVMTRHHMALGAFHRAVPLIGRAVEVLRTLGEPAAAPLGFALTYYGRALASQADLRDEADRVIDEALALLAPLDAQTGHIERSHEMEVAIRLHVTLAGAFKAFTIDPHLIDARREALTRAVETYSSLSPGHFIIGIMLSNLAELSIEAGDYARALEEASRTVEFYHGPGSGFGYIWALNAAGTASLALGAVEDAREHGRELLSLARRIGSAPGLGMALLLLAATEAADGDARAAAGLLGAWETCAGKIDTPAGPTDYLCARTTAALRERLTEEELAAGIAAGRSWTLDAALAAAARVTEPRPAALARE
jgi:predicted ATPase/class 3 adenylate cyclase